MDDSFGGGFNRDTGEVVTFAKGDPSNIPGATTRATSGLVHELVHSGTANLNEPSFLDEVLGGIGEVAYLQWLSRNGRWQAPADVVLRSAGVELKLPGRFRYYEPADKAENTSSGLVAVRGIRPALRYARITAGDILSVSSLGGKRQFDVMRRSLDSLHLGLANEVTKFPDTFDGMVQASATIQEVANKKNK